MERSKGIILIVAVLATILIIWQVAFKGTQESGENDEAVQTEQPSDNSQEQVNSETPENPDEGTQNGRGSRMQTRGGNNPEDNRTTPELAQAVNMKITIPEDISEEKLQVLYDEYRTIISSGRRGRNTGFTRQRGNMGGGRGNMNMDNLPGGMSDFMNQMNTRGFPGGTNTSGASDETNVN